MSGKLSRSFYLKVTQEEGKKLRAQETMNELEISGWLLVLSMVYTAVCWFFKNSQVIALIAYVMLLVAVSWTLFRIKKRVYERDEEGFVLSEKRASALFTLLLLGNSLYFFMCWLRDKDSSSLSMAIINAMLYIGFAVSLEGLFKIKRWWEVFRCFYAPFTDFCRGCRDLIKIIVATIIIILLVLANSGAIMIAIFIVEVVMLIAVYCLVKYRKESLREFCEFVVSISRGKHVLIWEMGGSSIVRKGIQKGLLDINDGDSLVPIDNIDTADKWDVVIVLNSIHKKIAYLPSISKLSSIIAKDGVVVDPFISNEKGRRFLRSWLGIPSRKTKAISVEEYMVIVN